MEKPKKKIFVFEDDDQLARVYNIKLSKEGYDVTLLASGEGGIEKISSEKPDLIIMDLMLPRKDGFAILEELKKDLDLATIPVIVLSNLGQKSDQDRALSLGAKEYLIKVDHSMMQLVEMVKGYLKG